jgi:hypothetical protein
MVINFGLDMVIIQGIFMLCFVYVMIIIVIGVNIGMHDKLIIRDETFHVIF